MKAILCNARHQHPEIADLPAIFPTEVTMDFCALDLTADEFVTMNLEVLNKEGLDLFVTGMSPAMCAVIRTCLNRDVELRLWHYDKSTDTYVCQPMLVRDCVEQGWNDYGVDVMVAPRLS